MRTFARFMGGFTLLCSLLGLAFPALADNKNLNYLILKGGIYSPQNEKLYNFEFRFQRRTGFGTLFK